MAMAVSRDRRSRIEEEAGHWLVRMREAPSEGDRHDFIAWYNADPEHRSIYDGLAHLWDAAPRARLRSPLAERPERRLPPRRLSYALTALIAACVVGAAMLVANLGQSPTGTPRQELLLFATAVGEIRAVPVADGLEVTLDSDSALRLSPDRRRLQLARGRVRVAVESGAGPVLVEAGVARIDVEEAVVDVRLEQGGAVVTPIEGVVAVAVAWAQQGEPRRVAAPQSLTVSPAAATLLARPDRSSSWPGGMLEFDDARMSAVIAEANRYGSRPIRLGDPRLGGLRVTGAFQAGDTEGLAASLAAAFSLELAEEPDGSLLLRRRSGEETSGGEGGKRSG